MVDWECVIGGPLFRSDAEYPMSIGEAYNAFKHGRKSKFYSLGTKRAPMRPTKQDNSRSKITGTTHCKFCGKRALFWKKDKNGKWRLYDDTMLHSCIAYKGSAKNKKKYSK